MSLLQRLCKTLGVLGLAVASPLLVSGQSTNYYAAQGGEFLPADSLAGDQIRPALAVTHSGGFLVWQDNITDGDGFGISAVRLSGTFSQSLAIFRVNAEGAFDQENPRVTLLQNGNAVFVWQGGKTSLQHIYARYYSTTGGWITGDVMVNSTTNKYQTSPAIATLANGNVIVTWASYGQDNGDRLQGVYAQILSPTGQKVGDEFLVNQFTPYNQRTPAVAAFPGGGMIFAWVSEKQNASQVISPLGSQVTGTATGVVAGDSVEIYARIFNSDGSSGSEFLASTGSDPCANPSIAITSDGGFLIAWSQKDLAVHNNSWDAYSRKFTSAAAGSPALRLNTQQYGDQYVPQMASLGTDLLAVWTSLGQDGSREGVYGQFLRGDGSHLGNEFRVNTTILNQQEFPAVASDGVGNFLVTWSSYAPNAGSVDLKGQIYSTTLQPLSPPGAPFALALSSSRLSVTWQPVSGYNVVSYGLYIDGAITATNLTNNLWPMSGLAPSSTHSFKLDYLLADGRRSPQSTTAYGTTWGDDSQGAGGVDFSDGLPDNWQSMYWGPSSVNWPAPGTHIGGPGGPTVAQIFQWGASPFDQNTWLKTSMGHTPQGWFFYWNTVPGSIYEVDTSANLSAWSALGPPRFAAGTNDSVFIGISNQGYYRVKRIRF